MESNLKNVCIEILKISKEVGVPAKNLRLQKLLYFIQAYSIISNDKKIFEEEIEAWPYGPVVPRAYELFKQNQLDELKESNVDEYKKKIIKEVVEAFKKWNDYEIVNLTHSYELWKEKVRDIYGGKCMSCEEIKEYHLMRLKENKEIF